MKGRFHDVKYGNPFSYRGREYIRVALNTDDRTGKLYNALEIGKWNSKVLIDEYATVEFDSEPRTFEDRLRELKETCTSFLEDAKTLKEVDPDHVEVVLKDTEDLEKLLGLLQSGKWAEASVHFRSLDTYVREHVPAGISDYLYEQLQAVGVG